MTMSPLQAMFMCLGAFLLWQTYVFVYSLLLSPLSKVPGPFLARFTSLWELFAIQRGNYHEEIIRLHDRYGPIVRIGPNRYMFNTISALKSIYVPTGKFPKSDWYVASGHPGRPNFLNMQDERHHAAEKRKVASLYAMSTVISYEESVDKMNEVMMQSFRELSEAQKCINLPSFMQFYAFDVMGQITMDRSFNLMKVGKDHTGVLQMIQQFTWSQMAFGLYPNIWLALFRLLTLLRLPSPNKKLLEHIEETVAHYRKSGVQDKQKKEAEPFLSKLLNLEMQGKLNGETIFSTCANNIVAGSDTTGISLGACFYHVYRNTDVLHRLREEVNLFEQEGLLSNPPKFKEAQQMPYLQAVIQETLRIHPAVSQMLSREVPRGGVQLEGYHLPEKTQVGISAWALHYNTNIYDDPFVFRPERWLNDSARKPTNLASPNFSFGGGSRVCLGKHISLLEMTKVIPQVIRNFDIRFEKPEKPWEIHTSWFVSPSYNCWIQERKLPAKAATKREPLISNTK